MVNVPVRVLVLALAATVALTVEFPVPLVGDNVAHETPEEALNAHPLWVVTETGRTWPVAGTEAVAGETPNVHEAAADCVTVTAWPATVTVPVRELVEVLAATVSVTEPLPDPPVGDTVIQLAAELAFHPHADELATVTANVPPVFPGANPVGDTLYVHAAGACVTVTAFPATVTVPVRDVVAGFAPTVIVVVPFPDPLAGDAVIQLTPDEAVHPHPEPADTLITQLPPPLVIDTLVGDTENVQPVPPESVNALDTLLREVPFGPAAATRDSYTPPGSGQPPTWLLKSKRTTPSACGAGFPMSVVVNGDAAPFM
jgi:hypothetical protein